MSTHYIEEAERLCDSVTIMSHGSAVATGSPRDLVARARGRRGGRGLRAAGQAGRGRARGARGGPQDAPHGHVASRVLGANGNAPDGERRPTNLEDVFVLLTGEEIA